MIVRLELLIVLGSKKKLLKIEKLSSPRKCLLEGSGRIVESGKMTESIKKLRCFHDGMQELTATSVFCFDFLKILIIQY